MRKSVGYRVEAGDQVLEVVFVPSGAALLVEWFAALGSGALCLVYVALAVYQHGLSTDGWLTLLLLGLFFVLYLPSLGRWRRERMVVTKDLVTHHRGIWPAVVTPLEDRRFCVIERPPFLSFGFTPARVGLVGVSATFGRSVLLSDADAEALVATLNAFLDAGVVLRTSAST